MNARNSANASRAIHQTGGRGRTALRLVVAGALSALLAVSGAGANDRRDHERARAAVQAGEVLPLPTLLERLHRSHPGQVLELELEREGDRWLYEIKLLQAGGQLMKLDVDAATGEVLGARRRKPERSAPASALPE